MIAIDNTSVVLLNTMSVEPVRQTNQQFIRACIRNLYNQVVRDLAIKSFIKLDMADDKIVDFICQAFADESQCISCPFNNYNAPDCEKHLREFFYKTYDSEDIVMKTIVQTMKV